MNNRLLTIVCIILPTHRLIITLNAAKVPDDGYSGPPPPPVDDGYDAPQPVDDGYDAPPPVDGYDAPDNGEVFPYKLHYVHDVINCSFN